MLTHAGNVLAAITLLSATSLLADDTPTHVAPPQHPTAKLSAPKTARRAQLTADTKPGTKTRPLVHTLHRTARKTRDPQNYLRHRRITRQPLVLTQWYGGGYYSLSPDQAGRYIEETYRARRRIRELERQRRFNRRDMAKRKRKLLGQHEQALAAGLDRLSAGDATRATVAFTLAAKVNQGDPASRIHLAQARLVLGHYREAGLALHRALELQPKLVYADLHLDDYYARPGTLGSCIERLRSHLERTPNARPETSFLLGFLEFQQGEFAVAHEALQRARPAMPEDDLVRDLLDITKPPDEPESARSGPHGD